MTNKPQFVGERVKLGDLISKAKVERCGDRSFPVYSMTMHDGIVEQSGRFKKAIASKDRSSYKVVKKNQLVVGFPIDEGVIYVQNHERAGIMSPAYNVWDFDSSRITPAYLELALHSPQSMAYYAEKLRGTTARRRSLTADGLRALPIVLPSIERQSAVVEVLKGIKGQIADARKTTDELDHLVKSRFVEMFGDPVANPKGWDVSTIKKTAITYGDGPFGSNLKSADYVPSGVRVIRLGNIMCGEFSEKDQSYVSYEKFESLRKYECTPGEVVIATLGNPILRACIVPDFGVPSIHKADCIYYETNKEMVLPVFAMCAINHLSMLQRALLDSHEQTRARINSTQAGNLPMILPPMDLQQEFAAFVSQADKSRFAWRAHMQLRVLAL